YRRANPEYAEYQAHKLFEELEIGLMGTNTNVLRGKKVIEVRSAEANKGYFVRSYLEALPENAFAIVFGDDRTDEDMFYAVKDRGVSVRIGVSRETYADYCLTDQTELIKLLRHL